MWFAHIPAPWTDHCAPLHIPAGGPVLRQALLHEHKEEASLLEESGPQEAWPLWARCHVGYREGRHPPRCWLVVLDLRVPQGGQKESTVKVSGGAWMGIGGRGLFGICCQSPAPHLWKNPSAIERVTCQECYRSKNLVSKHFISWANAWWTTALCQALFLSWESFREQEGRGWHGPTVYILMGTLCPCSSRTFSGVSALH